MRFFIFVVRSPGVMDGFMFWRLAHPIVASASSQIDFLNTITVGLLDVLAVALLLLALATYFFYSRTRRQSIQGRGSAPGRAQRNVSTIASIMLAVPVVWLLVVWGGTSLLNPSPSGIQPTPIPSAKPSKMTPTPKPNPRPSIAPPNDLISPGTLTVGSDTSNPPQEFLDPTTQQPMGFDIDLITAIAHKMGLQVKIVPTAFSSLLDGLNSGLFDVVISAVNITPDRQVQSEFVPYFKGGESLLVQASNPKRFKQLSDICGLSVGVQDGSREQVELNDANTVCQAARKPGITVTKAATEVDVIKLLLNGTVEATYQDTAAVDYYMPQYPGKFAVAGEIPAPNEGIMIRKGDTAIFDAVNAAFASLKHDGTYHKLLGNWHLTNEALGVIDRRSGVV
jgi:polar amino acid transport system substrate-binding protein